MYCRRCETDRKADIEADMRSDRNEQIALMNPLTVVEGSPHRAGLADLAFDLIQRATGFRRSLPDSLVEAIADLVRGMNCYYSNLIEGHNTHPIDIERALNQEFSTDHRKRDLQREAVAHIRTQAWIDSGGLAGNRATTIEGIQEIHRRFCSFLPEDLLWAEDPNTKERIPLTPGELRDRDVMVGPHLAVSPGALPRFLQRFEDFYGALGKSERLIAVAAAHHRLLWIHPFLDGNGRVARLVSHAQLLDLLDTGAIWSVARGLARNVEQYKQLLSNCDQTRRNDLDGRGNLSEEALAAFTRFFLKTCLDQVAFMEALIQPEKLRVRVGLWVEEEMRLGRLPAKSGLVLDAVLFRGELARGDVDVILGTGERQARRVVAALLERGVLSSESSRAPLRLRFPAAIAPRWMPGLFPELPDAIE